MKLIVIGSSDKCHVRLSSPYVSGYHAELLLLDNGELLLTDKGSRNGTYLNDQRLQPNKDIAIKRGDNVRFADIMLDWKNIPDIPMPDLSKIKEMRGIGTNFRNKYQIQGEQVSRFHATLIRKSDGKWYIQDHSKNGTTINGQKIPSNQEIRLKRKDVILCAGVSVPNPLKEVTSKVNYKRILMMCLSIFILCGGIYGIFRLVKRINSTEGATKDIVTKCNDFPQLSDEEIYAKHKNSTVLLLGFYYYKVSAGSLDLKEVCGIDTEVVLVNGKVRKVNGARSNMNSYTGTGFFVSDDGKIATNLHIVRPWLFNSDMTIISDQYKMFLAAKASEYPVLNAYISQVKVEGVLSYIGLVPNGAYFSEENLKQCRELVAHNNTDKDVAILQLETKKLPNENSTYVSMNSAIIEDSGIKVGSHIYTMGFPFGLNLQDLKSTKGMQILANGGSITQECTTYAFTFNAPSYGGASGSPIFNNKGQLVGVLNAGVTKSQGFNYGIKAVYVKDLLDESNKDKR